MKILVTGAAGQLGRELLLMLQAAGEEAVGIDRAELDLSRPERVAEGIAAQGADWVIHCAAYTQVDKAEEERELAFRINRDAARAVAQGVRASGGRLLHVSTDFIFDGAQSRPYREDDAANPLGVYGQSKWEGEQAVREVLPEAVILRTAWVYGAHGHNFVKTMLRLAAEREELRVVDDQVGTPAWTADIATAIRALIGAGASGTWHFTNEGVASWYDFAESILGLGRELGFPVKARGVRPIPTSDFPTPAKRPPWSVLSKRKIRGLLDHDIPHWRQSLERMLKEIL
ncbi:dTDP-4-dehydrorhamnose reductase [Thiohalobacter sp. IOR34]|uniref:dTDP-4-dehydrorhamnose reductase n=1 Tax=Thiohalobacter sp. IOR34 TaxID=3057176 RepID=UPI0025AFFB18|nr:dTDP-4-dehydrorhamnose reductase [Thiohalobacter sp. IOR34]WJW76724.1 dTDP-4-dehydrorhamnose reductase [Thiohalobacter sp. IOR34]